MIDQTTTIRKESVHSASSQYDIQQLKQQNINNTTSTSTQLQSNNNNNKDKDKYFHNPISSDRNVLLEKIIKDYEQNDLSTSQECISKSNSRDSLSSLIPTNTHPINNKFYILNDTSSYSTAATNTPMTKYVPTHYSKQTNFLKPSMAFTGYQISGYKRYQVTVTLKTVNFPSSNITPNTSAVPHMTGILSIKGLTYHQDEISTYFESFAVTDNNFGFLSSSFNNHDLNLTSNDLNDMQHWLNFPAFKEMFQVDANTNTVNTPNYIPDYLNKRYIFMRWKEKFLIDDPEMNSIEGASFDGYYYIVHDQYTGNIQGFYYHKDAEIFQQLELLPYAKSPGSSSFDFA